MTVLRMISISLLISLIFSNNLEAQLLKKLKKRVQEVTEDVIADKAAQKVGQETGKALDSLLEIDPDYQSNYQEQLNLMMSSGSENIPIEESYSFSTQVMYELTTMQNNKPSIVNYEMWFSKNDGYMATQVKGNNDENSKDMPSSMVSIFDDKNQAMIILLEEQKMAQLLSMSKIKEVAEKENEIESENTVFESIQKTGKTKKILGYTCEEFSSQNDSNKFSYWITQDLALFQKNMFFNISKSLGGNTFEEIPDHAKGFMMEMHFENLTNNEKGSMTVINIQKADKNILMSEYQLMSLGQFMQK